MNGLERQREIYIAGGSGIKPNIPTDFCSLEDKAKQILQAEAYAYIATGAGVETTMNRNRQAFDQVQILPQMLRNVGERDTSTTFLGRQIPAPFYISPIGVLEMAHPQADLAVARAAAEMNVPFIFSNQASVPMEKTAAVMGDAQRLFQLYWSKSDDLTASLVQRAEAAGCSAIVVTLDTTLLGWRPRDLNAGFLPFLRGMGIAQYTSDPVFQRLMDEPETGPQPARKIRLETFKTLFSMVNHYPGNGFISKLRSGRPLKAVRTFIRIYSRPTLTWDDLSFLRQHTRLPIILKGILDPDDASKAIDYGMDGIIVSNHGGRQVDGGVSTFEMLPRIVAATGPDFPVYMDSGIRTGADIFKALAMGAKAVGLGRPYVYALGLGGQQGVTDYLKNMMAEFDLTMGLAGCKNISEITRDRLI